MLPYVPGMDYVTATSAMTTEQYRRRVVPEVFVPFLKAHDICETDHCPLYKLVRVTEFSKLNFVPSNYKKVYSRIASAIQGHLTICLPYMSELESEKLRQLLVWYKLKAAENDRTEFKLCWFDLLHRLYLTECRTLPQGLLRQVILPCLEECSSCL